MEAIQQTKGRRGGLAIIIIPDIEYTELFRCAIGADFEAQKEGPLAPKHIEHVTLQKSENALPNGEVEVEQSLTLEASGTTETPTKTPPTPPSQESTTRPNTKNRKRKPSTKQKNKNKGKTPTPKSTNGTKENSNTTKANETDQVEQKEQEFIQAITISLKNGLTVTGAYIGPQTNSQITRSFLTDTLRKHGENHILVGDLNARNSSWETITNERGTAVTEVVEKTHRAYVVATKEPSYYKK